MFDMFRGGKSDPMTLYIVDQEEHKDKLNIIVNIIREYYHGSGVIDLDDLASEIGIDIDLTDDDIDYIENQLRY